MNINESKQTFRIRKTNSWQYVSDLSTNSLINNVEQVVGEDFMFLYNENLDKYVGEFQVEFAESREYIIDSILFRANIGKGGAGVTSQNCTNTVYNSDIIFDPPLSFEVIAPEEETEDPPVEE